MKAQILLCLALFHSLCFGEFLSLENAYNQVLHNNDGLKATQNAALKQEKLSSATKLIYLPQISVVGNYTRIDEPINLQFVNPQNAAAAMSANPTLAAQYQPLLSLLSNPTQIQDKNIILGAINIIYPLFTGGKRHFANELSAIAKDDALLALKLKELALFEDCVRLYYAVVLQKQILNTLESASKGHLAHYENAKKLETRGQIARLESLQAQVNYDKSLIDVQKAKDNLNIAQMALNALLGRESSEIDIAQSIHIRHNENLKPLEYFVNKSLEVYPPLRVMENKTKAAKALSRIEFSSFLPEVGLYGSYLMNDNSSLIDKAMPRWYVGVGIRWSLLSPAGRIQKYQASKIASLEASFATSQAKKDLKTLCEKTYSEALSFKAQHKSLESSIELAREHLKLREKAFMQGMSTSAEVSDAQNALSLAIIEQQNIAYLYAIALARLFALSDEVGQYYQFF